MSNLSLFTSIIPECAALMFIVVAAFCIVCILWLIIELNDDQPIIYAQKRGVMVKAFITGEECKICSDGIILTDENNEDFCSDCDAGAPIYEN